MFTFKAQSAGGKATAKILRERAFNEYYSSPNFCLECGSIIEVPLVLRYQR